MPITITEGPISAALNLAQQAGYGEGWRIRQATAERALDRVDRQANQALNLRSQQTQEAIAYDRMAQTDRFAQERQATQRATLAAQQQRQGRQDVMAQGRLDLSTRSQELAERRQEVYEEYKPKEFELKQARLDIRETAAETKVDKDLATKQRRERGDIEKRVRAAEDWITSKIPSFMKKFMTIEMMEPPKGMSVADRKTFQNLKEFISVGRRQLADYEIGAAPAAGAIPIQAGAPSPQGTTVMIGRTPMPIPAPPAELVAPAPNTPLEQYPDVKQGLMDHFERFVMSKMTPEEAEANLDQINAAFDSFAQQQGWAI